MYKEIEQLKKGQKGEQNNEKIKAKLLQVDESTTKPTNLVASSHEESHHVAHDC